VTRNEKNSELGARHTADGSCKKRAIVARNGHSFSKLSDK